VLKNLNLALRFALELCALGLLAYWGVRSGGQPVVRIVLGIGLPVLAAVFWGSFVSPKARFGGSRKRRLLLGLLVFLLAAMAFMNLGHVLLGVLYGTVTILNTALTYAWGPQPGETSPAA
jgi:hypothetical protein